MAQDPQTRYKAFMFDDGIIRLIAAGTGNQHHD